MTTNPLKESKFLAIFPNFKEIVDALPYKKRARAWHILIDFSFGENIDLTKEDAMTRMAVNAIIPLIKLRKISGVKQGTVNNPTGKNGKYLANNEVNNEDNIKLNNEVNNDVNNDVNSFIKEKKRKENKVNIQFLRLGEFKNVCLTNDDYERLKSTNTELDKAIERLDGWLETSNGSKNKNRNHRGYFKSNSWVWEKTGNQVIKPLILDLDEMLKVSEEERKGWTKEQWDKYYEEFEKRGGE